MININDIKAGDTVMLRNGGRLEVKETPNKLFTLGGILSLKWNNHGSWVGDAMAAVHLHPFDIIAIEPKLEPRKLERFIRVWFDDDTATISENSSNRFADQIWKITFTEGGEPTFEEVQNGNI